MAAKQKPNSSSSGGEIRELLSLIEQRFDSLDEAVDTLAEKVERIEELLQCVPNDGALGEQLHRLSTSVAQLRLSGGNDSAGGGKDGGSKGGGVAAANQAFNDEAFCITVRPAIYFQELNVACTAAMAQLVSFLTSRMMQYAASNDVFGPLATLKNMLQFFHTNGKSAPRPLPPCV